VSNKHFGGEVGRGGRGVGGALSERILFLTNLLSFNFFDMHIFQLPYFLKNLFASNFNTLNSFTF
jgi:hypothetical protein